MTQQRILVIKLSAFGDFCLSMGIFEHLRNALPNAHITLMTTAPFKELAQQSPYFNEARTIARWGTFAFGPWLRYARSVRAAPYDQVYDLQSNDRTRMLHRLSPAAMRRNWYDVRSPQTRPAQTLDLSAFIGKRPTDLSWLTSHAIIKQPAQPYALLVPGSAPQHPAKRWPASRYAALAELLVKHGITPVLIGTSAEAEATQLIATACPQALNLTAKTTFADLALLAQGAQIAIGNDTGPMHLIALAGRPIVSLFSAASNPAQSAPRGNHVHVLQRDNLADLSVDEVYDCINKALSA